METSSVITVTNPATEEIITSYEAHTEADIHDVVHKLKMGQKAWRETDLKDRSHFITNFREILERQSEVCAEVQTAETGKPIDQSKGEINATRNRIDYFLKESPSILEPMVLRKTTHGSEKISRDPLGTIANISAWNYPYFIGTNVIIPALLTGNQVVYKPSEWCLNTGIKIVEMFWEAGIPKDVLDIVIGGSAQGSALINTPIDGLFFTGSHGTGQKILYSSREKMIPIQLELGGKDAVYVTENCDLTDAITQILHGIFYNNGQGCCSVERLYLHDNIYQDFVDGLLHELNQLKIGDPKQTGTYFGPLTRKAQGDVLIEQINDALKKGAQLLAGGKKIDGTGYFFEPTVLAKANHQMSVMKEESFGPIVGIQQVRDDQEAIALMNDSHYGLTAAVFCSDETRGKHLLKHLDTGTAYLNCCDRVSPHLPWSGRRGSGMGATLGKDGISCFTRPKSWHMRRVISQSLRK